MLNYKILIEKLAQNEEDVAELYEKYSLKFPNIDLWQELAADEHQHFGWIRILADKISGTNLIINNIDHFQTEILNISREIKSFNKVADTHNLNRALRCALAIENDILEKEFFKQFSSDDPQVKHILKRIEKSTQLHQERILKRLKKLL